MVTKRTDQIECKQVVEWNAVYQLVFQLKNLTHINSYKSINYTTNSNYTGLAHPKVSRGVRMANVMKDAQPITRRLERHGVHHQRCDIAQLQSSQAW